MLCLLGFFIFVPLVCFNYLFNLNCYYFLHDWLILLELNIDKLQEYLSSVYDAPVTILDFLPLGKKEDDIEKVLKAFGYGIPYIIEFSIGEKSEKKSLTRF